MQLSRKEFEDVAGKPLHLGTLLNFRYSAVRCQPHLYKSIRFPRHPKCMQAGASLWRRSRLEDSVSIPSLLTIKCQHVTWTSQALCDVWWRRWAARRTKTSTPSARDRMSRLLLGALTRHPAGGRCRSEGSETFYSGSPDGRSAREPMTWARQVAAVYEDRWRII